MALSAICVLFNFTAGSVTAASTTIVAKDLDGRSRTLFSQTNASAKALVFIFILPDCPICNSYAPELKRLRRAFPQIEFYLVYADPDSAGALRIANRPSDPQGERAVGDALAILHGCTRKGS